MKIKELAEISNNRIFIRWTDSDGTVRHKEYRGHAKDNPEVVLIEAGKMPECGTAIIAEIETW